MAVFCQAKFIKGDPLSRVVAKKEELIATETIPGFTFGFSGCSIEIPVHGYIRAASIAFKR